MLTLAVCLLTVTAAVLAPPAAGVRVPLELDRWGRGFVRVYIGSAGPYRFLLDTGSTMSAVSGEVASRLELMDAGRIATRSLGRSGSARLVHVPPVQLGARRFMLRWMIVLEKDRLDSSGGLDGVVGQDLLGQLDYLIEPASKTLWIDPPATILRGLTGVRVPLHGVSRPLAVIANTSRAEWGIDTGASHPVIFRDGIARSVGSSVDAITPAGRHRVDRLAPASIDVGGQWFSWDDAVFQRRPDRAEHGLLPLSMFDAIYVSNRDRYALLTPRRSRKVPRPDVAASFGPLEDDAGAARRPGRIADVAIGHSKLGELPHLAGPRRD